MMSKTMSYPQNFTPFANDSIPVHAEKQPASSMGTPVVDIRVVSAACGTEARPWDHGGV